jgi:hypothetical protein
MSIHKSRAFPIRSLFVSAVLLPVATVCVAVDDALGTAGAAQGAVGNEPFFHDGRTDWKICLSPHAAPMEAFAAEELRAALKKISGAEFEVLSSAEAPHRRAIIIGDLNNPQA